MLRTVWLPRATVGSPPNPVSRVGSLTAGGCGPRELANATRPGLGLGNLPLVFSPFLRTPAASSPPASRGLPTAGRTCFSPEFSSRPSLLGGGGVGEGGGEGCLCPLSCLVGLQECGQEREERREKGTEFLDAHRDGGFLRMMREDVLIPGYANM